MHALCHSAKHDDSANVDNDDNDDANVDNDDNDDHDDAENDNNSGWQTLPFS